MDGKGSTEAGTSRYYTRSKDATRVHGPEGLQIRGEEQVEEPLSTDFVHRASPSISKSRRSSKRIGSCASHNSRLLNKEVDFKLKEELAALEEEEAALSLRLTTLVDEIAEFKEICSEQQADIDDITGKVEDRERKELKKTLLTNKSLLRGKIEERARADLRIKAIRTKRELVKEKADLEKEKIADDLEQDLNSDDEYVSVLGTQNEQRQVN